MRLRNAAAQLSGEGGPAQRLRQLADVQRLQRKTEAHVEAAVGAGGPQAQVFDAGLAAQHRQRRAALQLQHPCATGERQAGRPERQPVQPAAVPAQGTGNRCAGGETHVTFQALELEAPARIVDARRVQHQGGIAPHTIGQREGGFGPARQLQVRKTNASQPAGQVARGQCAQVRRLQRQRGIAQRQVWAECQHALHVQAAGVVPAQPRQLPAAVAGLRGQQCELDRTLAQGNVGRADQQFATLQLPVQRHAVGIAERHVQVQVRPEPLGGDAAIGCVQCRIAPLQRPADAQRLPRRCAHGQLGIALSAQQPRLGPAVGQQCLCPRQRHAGQVDAGQFRGGRVASHRNARGALRQHRAGRPATQRHRQPHRVSSAVRLALHRAVALPALGIALQRTLPVQRAEPVAQVRCVHAPGAQPQRAARSTRRPAQLHDHVVQRRHRSLHSLDPGRGHPCLRIGHGHHQARHAHDKGQQAYDPRQYGRDRGR